MEIISKVDIGVENQHIISVAMSISGAGLVGETDGVNTRKMLRFGVFFQHRTLIKRPFSQINMNKAIGWLFGRSFLVLVYLTLGTIDGP